MPNPFANFAAGMGVNTAQPNYNIHTINNAFETIEGIGSPSSGSSSIDKSYRPSSRSEALEELWKLAQNGDTAAKEKYLEEVINYDNTLTSLDRAEQREDTYAQRLVKDLEKAGISPYILSGVNPSAASASFHSSSGSQMTSQANSKRSEDAQLAKSGMSTFAAIIAALGLVLAHMV